MDAAVMMSSPLSSGACCGIRTVKHPVLLAEYIRTQTPHTCIGFQAADELAIKAGLECEDPEWFVEENRKLHLRTAVERKQIVRDHDIDSVPVLSHCFQNLAFREIRSEPLFWTWMAFSPVQYPREV